MDDALNLDETPVKKKKRACVKEGPQINRSRTGRKMTDEERKAKQERSDAAKKLKSDKKSTALSKLAENVSIESTEKSVYFDEEPDVWVEEISVKSNIDEEEPYEDSNNPAIVERARSTVQSDEIDESEPIVLQKLPEVGTTIKNPLKLSDSVSDIYGTLDRLYGHIGFFVLSEQILPIKEKTIKLIQLKLDDGRFINLFIQL
jgi:hypothetical protein